MKKQINIYITEINNYKSQIQQLQGGQGELSNLKQQINIYITEINSLKQQLLVLQGENNSVKQQIQTVQNSQSSGSN